jgi:hypothetical protein
MSILIGWVMGSMYPIFGNMAFTNEVSPFLMCDYAALKSLGPTTKKDVLDYTHITAWKWLPLLFRERWSIIILLAMPVLSILGRYSG